MQLSRKALDAYNAAIKRQGGNAEMAVRAALEAWFSENSGATIAETRDFSIALLDEIARVYGGAAGDAAYALRSLCAEAAGIEPPDIDYEYAPGMEHIEKVPRYQVEKLKSGDVGGFIKEMLVAARYYAERGANDTMANLGKADAKKLGKKVRFARVPTGATTCPYCCMLASRGFVYHTELTALNANHRNCDCRIVEGFAGMTVEGYDPNYYYDVWKHPEKYESQETTQVSEQVANLIDRQFNGVSSIDEANDRAAAYVDMNAYKAKVDMKGMNVEAANSMLKALDAVYSSYDVAPLRSIQRMNKQTNEFRNSVAEAAYRWWQGDLYYNSDFVKTAKAMAAHHKESKDLLDEVLGGDLARLKAKYASNTSKIRYIEALEKTGRAMVAQGHNEFEEVIYAHELGHMLDDRLFTKSGFDRRASFEKYSGSISAYATTDVKEYMAESFASFYAGDTERLDPDLVGLFREMMK